MLLETAVAILPSLPAPFFWAVEVFGNVTLVLIVFRRRLCAGKVRTVRLPKPIYLLVVRDSDVRTVLTILVSFSVSRIVFLYSLSDFGKRGASPVRVLH